MASLTGNLVAETYKALLKTIDNDILTASEKQITDGFGGGSNVFIDSNGFLRANKYKVTNGLATQFLKADGSLDANTYLTSINSSQIIAALGFTPVTNARTLTINGTTYDLSANRSWTIAGTSAVWGNITGTLSNQTDLQTALNAKFNNPTGTISQYIRGDGSIATFPTLPGGLPIGGTTGQILAKINATDYNTEWIDNFATQTKNEVKLGQTLAKGAAVYVSSANGTNIIVSAASNTTEALSSKTFGLLETGGATNAFVKCVTFGLLAGLDTSTATAGDPVWLGVNGALIFGLANKPFAPAHLVYIGVVTRVQSNNGEIFVNVQNGFELKEIHDVLAQSPTNNDGLFYESATSLWKNKSIATVLGYTPQAQLNGTGFVKASGTTISYDNSTYLNTTDAASTYQRLDKMVSNLLASATEYPNSNAVIAALALKADAANPVFTGNMTISGAEPKLTFTDTDQNPDYFIGVDAGFFRIYDQTAGLTRFVINSSGVTTIAGDLIVGTIAKTGGTASQFLKADGTIDSSTYVTSAILANYLLSATAASTYQTLANLSTDLTASATKYPSVNAVVTGLGTKQPLDADLTAIAALVGTTGFLIKTAADTWSLDTNTYLTTTSAASTYLTQTTAASTYQRLDKMVSNLLASSTEYPNSNAVLAKLALKADAANPVFTGDLTISGATPRLYFVDTDQNPDYTVFIDSGYFYIYDQTAGATRFSINSSGNISTGVGKSITAGSFIKESGTADQFLKANGSVDSTVYGTGSVTSVAAITLGTTGTDLSSTVATGTTTPVITLNVPTASATNRGALSAADWTTFNGKQAALSGTGFVKISGTTISYDNSTYLTTSSASSTYLPLAGGTLTGALSGTTISTSGSATFGSDVFTYANGGIFFNGGGSYTSGIFQQSGGTLALQTGGSPRITIASTGAATFSSSVTTGGDIAVNSTTVSINSTSYPKIRLNDTNVGGGIYYWQSIIGKLRLVDEVAGAERFSISSTGAATFSSSVNVNGASYTIGRLNVSSGAGKTNTNDNVIAFLGSNDASNPLGLSIQHKYVGSIGQINLIGTVQGISGNPINLNESIFVNYAGNVGIGNGASYAPYLLTLNVTGGGQTFGGIDNSNGASLGLIQFNAGSMLLNARGNGDVNNMLFYTGGSERMRITSAGNVGIGTTAPSVKLHVADSTGGRLILQGIGGSGTNWQFNSYTDGNLYIGRYNIADYVAITSGGNVLIGTTTDSGYKLNVSGTAIFATATVSNGDQAAARVIITNTGTGGQSINLIAGNPNVDQTGFSIAYGNANFLRFNSSAAATFSSSITATSFFESSSVAFKNILATNPITALNVDVIKYKRTNVDVDDVRYGYSAEQINSLMPELTNKEATAVKYLDVHTLLIAELQREIKELKAKLN